MRNQKIWFPRHTLPASTNHSPLAILLPPQANPLVTTNAPSWLKTSLGLESRCKSIKSLRQTHNSEIHKPTLVRSRPAVRVLSSPGAFAIRSPPPRPYLVDIFRRPHRHPSRAAGSSIRMHGWAAENFLQWSRVYSALYLRTLAHRCIINDKHPAKRHVVHHAWAVEVSVGKMQLWHAKRTSAWRSTKHISG